MIKWAELTAYIGSSLCIVVVVDGVSWKLMFVELVFAKFFLKIELKLIRDDGDWLSFFPGKFVVIASRRQEKTIALACFSLPIYFALRKYLKRFSFLFF